MAAGYDRHYETPDFFGDAYPQLISFFTTWEPKGTILDLGCGQGRNALALARLGFEVLGLDRSRVGIAQMLDAARKEGLTVDGKVEDIYTWTHFTPFDVILLDSMFHFSKGEKEKETGFLRHICVSMKPGALLCICMQSQKNKLRTLAETLANAGMPPPLHREAFEYTFVDQPSGHTVQTPYLLWVSRKET